jgi:hypothetical protein
MPTCADIVTLALRLAGIIGLNTTPTASEAQNGLDALQGLYEGWATGGMFGRLTDVLVSSDYTAKEGERVRATGGVSITLPLELPGDAGAPRAPRDMALIETFHVATGVGEAHLYDRNEWVRLDGLKLTDEAPLALRDRLGLAATLAESYAEMFGGTISAGSAARARTFRGNLISKRGSTQERQHSDYF